MLQNASIRPYEKAGKPDSKSQRLANRLVKSCIMTIILSDYGEGRREVTRGQPWNTIRTSASRVGIVLGRLFFECAMSRRVFSKLGLMVVYLGKFWGLIFIKPISVYPVASTINPKIVSW
jgi:hypothetical protein